MIHIISFILYINLPKFNFVEKEKRKRCSMDDKKLSEDLSKIKKELFEMVTAIRAVYQRLDDCADDYKEESTIKTDWLNKKMR